ncbi:Aste57867_9725 [Aphanomyces stellatus]|uniref:Aste57867_9725 protein n=1 Tax=Aphanomyces stellatus TaxID=120398 RepID=A0A485KNM2_9STRA|nr:hypothetical protein As57867_009687 [Aphanomyces stellatus]VFT86604.1 Aste57867_9725 [Aphanomyces stellatus]
MVRSKEHKARGACVRMRKMRAKEKGEKERLHVQLSHLQDTLRRLQISRHVLQLASPAYKYAATVLLKYTQALQYQVQDCHQLLQLLYAWVAAQQPHSGLDAWMQSPLPTTSMLLADPVARRHGCEWWSQRIYHTAMKSLPQFPFDATAQDTIRSTLHTCETEHGVHVSAVESPGQFTVFASLEYVAAAWWRLTLEPQRGTHEAVLERMHDRLVVKYEKRHDTSSSRVSIVARVDDDDAPRIVLTDCWVAHDECHPLVDDREFRVHGFGWAVFEKVTDAITLVRASEVHFTPLTAHGLMPLEDMATRVYDVAPRELRQEVAENGRACVRHMRAAVESPTHAAAVKSFLRNVEQTYEDGESHWTPNSPTLVVQS